MKILLVSDHLGQGGAAIAANRICQALINHTDAEVTRFAFNHDSRVPSLGCPLDYGVGAKSEAIIRLFSRKNQPFWAKALRAGQSKLKLSSVIERTKPDTINLHNVHGASIGLKALFSTLANQRVVWTLHDMWSFTGRCAYSYDCPSYVNGCGPDCPTPTDYPALPPLHIAAAWVLKHNFIKYKASGFISPSRWLANSALRGSWANKASAVIPNPIDLGIFFPISKEAARQALGIPQNQTVFLLAAEHLKERRKGAHFIMPALQNPIHGPVSLLTMGHTAKLDIPGITHVPLGFIDDDRLKRLIYSAADLLIHAAPVDNFPNTILEAQACGTPVIAFNACGMPEMIIDGTTGILAPELHADALRKALLRGIELFVGNADTIRACAAHARDLGEPAKVANEYHRFLEAIRH